MCLTDIKGIKSCSLLFQPLRLGILDISGIQYDLAQILISQGLRGKVWENEQSGFSSNSLEKT